MFSKVRGIGVGKIAALIALFALVMLAAPAQALGTSSSGTGTSGQVALNHGNHHGDHHHAVPGTVQGGLATMDHGNHHGDHHHAVPGTVQGGLATMDHGNHHGDHHHAVPGTVQGGLATMNAGTGSTLTFWAVTLAALGVALVLGSGWMRRTGRRVESRA